MTGWTAAICGCRTNKARLVRATGSPFIGLYCLGKSPPARSPRPAATTTAATDWVTGPVLLVGRVKDLAAPPPGANRFHHRHGIAAMQHLRSLPSLTKLYAI